MKNNTGFDASDGSAVYSFLIASQGFEVAAFWNAKGGNQNFRC